MSGYDLFGFHKAYEGGEFEPPAVGAVRIKQSTSYDANASDTSSEGSSATANFSYGSSNSSRSKSESPSRAPARASASPKPPKRSSHDKGPAARSSLDFSDCSLPSNLSGRSSEASKSADRVVKASSPQPQQKESNAADQLFDSEYTGSAARTDGFNMGSFTELSDLESTGDTSSMENGAPAGGGSGGGRAASLMANQRPAPQQVQPKSILQKVSSFRRPIQRLGSTLSSRNNKSLGSPTCSSPSAGEQPTGWNIADDNSAFYVPTDIMQNLDFTTAERQRAPHGAGQRSRPSSRSATRSSGTLPRTNSQHGRRPSQTARPSHSTKPVHAAEQRRLSNRRGSVSSRGGSGKR